MNQKLKLGPLPSNELVKVTIAIPATLRDELEHYARLHAQSSGESPDVVRLIPHMLSAFMRSDRVFQKSGRGPID